MGVGSQVSIKAPIQSKLHTKKYLALFTQYTADGPTQKICWSILEVTIEVKVVTVPFPLHLLRLDISNQSPMYKIL